MRAKSFLCLATILVAWLGGCAIAPAPAGKIQTGTDGWITLHMLDIRNGWAEVRGRNGCRILHTSDGARTWTDVTPRPFPYTEWSCQFPKANMAWVSFYEGQILTTNAGKSWAAWLPLDPATNEMNKFFLGTEASSCRFFNARDALGIEVEVGMCSASYSFFETQNGGWSWKPAAFSGNFPHASENPGTIGIGDCDGSSVSYYPPRTVVIVQGDLMDESAKGVVRFSLTTDAGKTWRDVAVPLPAQYQDRLVQSLPPYFFDASNALLAVYLMRETSKGFVDPVLVLYSTRDGGNTWRTGGVAIPIKNDVFERDFNYVTPKDFFVHAGVELDVTHDGGRDWAVIQPNIDFAKVVQMQFADARHGWAVVSAANSVGDPDEYSFILYRTANGGKTWKKIH